MGLLERRLQEKAAEGLSLGGEVSSRALSISLISSSALRKWLCLPSSSQVTVPCQVAFCR